jgi:hypothetical protein
VGRWFEAKRDGKCKNCKKPVAKGDEMYAKSAGVYLCGECGLVAENTGPDLGPVEQAVEDDLATFPAEARRSAIAQSMLYMARQLDANDVSPRDVTNYTKEIRLGLLTLKDMYPPAEEADETELARQKRERRMREAGGI